MSKEKRITDIVLFHIPKFDFNWGLLTGATIFFMTTFD